MTDASDLIVADPMAVVAWPPPVPTNGRTNTTPQLDLHPADHNQIADALATLVAKVPLGRQGSATSASTGAITTTFTELMHVDITALANRRYRVTGLINGTTGAVTQVVWFELTDGANNRLQLANYHSSPGVLFTLSTWIEIPPGAAGARTYRLRVACNTGTATLGGGHALMVEDIGT